MQRVHRTWHDKEEVLFLNKIKICILDFCYIFFKISYLVSLNLLKY